MSPRPTDGAVAPTGTERKARMGSATSPPAAGRRSAAGTARHGPARRQRKLQQVVAVKRSCAGAQPSDAGNEPVGNDPGSSNLMDQSGKNPRHGQEEDWQFIGSTGCGRL